MLLWSFGGWSVIWSNMSVICGGITASYNVISNNIHFIPNDIHFYHLWEKKVDLISAIRKNIDVEPYSAETIFFLFPFYFYFLLFQISNVLIRQRSSFFFFSYFLLFTISNVLIRQRPSFFFFLFISISCSFK